MRLIKSELLKQMFPRHVIILPVRVPPFVNGVERIGVVIAKNQHAAALDPLCQRRMDIGRLWLHALIGQQQNLEAREII